MLLSKLNINNKMISMNTFYAVSFSCINDTLQNQNILDLKIKKQPKTSQSN